MTKKQIAREIGIWILTALLVLTFANAGIRKFFDGGGWTRMFRTAGFPDWFRIAIGVLEVGAAALLLVARTARYGAATIIVIMLGAIATVAMQGWTRGLPQPIVALVIAAIVFFMRSRRLAPQQ